MLDLAESDKGIYSCNLHHHYCHLYKTVKIQLDVTKKGKGACADVGDGFCFLAAGGLGQAKLWVPRALWHVYCPL